MRVFAGGQPQQQLIPDIARPAGAPSSFTAGRLPVGVEFGQGARFCQTSLLLGLKRRQRAAQLGGAGAWRSRATTDTRPWSRVNSSTIRLVSLYGTLYASKASGWVPLPGWGHGGLALRSVLIASGSATSSAQYSWTYDPDLSRNTLLSNSFPYPVARFGGDFSCAVAANRDGFLAGLVHSARRREMHKDCLRISIFRFPRSSNGAVLRPVWNSFSCTSSAAESARSCR